MKACYLTNTFTKRKIQEIAEMKVGKTLPPKQSIHLEVILEGFDSLEDIYQFLIDKSKQYEQDCKYYCMVWYPKIKSPYIKCNTP